MLKIDRYIRAKKLSRIEHGQEHEPRKQTELTDLGWLAAKGAKVLDDQNPFMEETLSGWK